VREPARSLDELRVHWHLDLALAYVRGSVPALDGDDPSSVLRAARERGLNLDPFKRSRMLPRVHEVLAMLRSLAPTSLIDLGTGRGRLLWHLLDTMPALEIVTVDREPAHVDRIEALRAGGVERVRGVLAEVEEVPLPNDSADVVTALEVFEHVHQPALLAREVARLARRFAIISVPSQADENPEHIHLLGPASLESLLLEAGARRVTFRQVPGHLIALADLRL
jgi:SAM-dependent methyltransferase